jgi:methionyl-tRNA formyltransferase
MVLFIGSKGLGLRVLALLREMRPSSISGVLTIDDRSDTRTALHEISAFSSRHGLPLHVAKNRGESERIIAQLKPDLCVVAGWYWLIGAACIDAVPSGIIGIHFSPLPRYRGGSPLVWQIIRGESKAWASFFSLTPGMDDGPIWAQASVPIGVEDYISDVLTHLESATLEALRTLFPAILDGTARPVEQDHKLATYCAQRFPEDGNIDWARSASQVYNFIRAQSDPYPGAFTFFDDKLLRVWRANVYPNDYYGTPGQVAQLLPEGVVVVCGGDTAITLKTVEFGGTRQAAAAVIRSIKFRLGPHPKQPESAA